MKVLGISAYYHDSAAALVVDGRIVAAAQEERFSRRKHDSGFPRQALAYCLAEGGLRPDAVDHVVFYEKPFLRFDRLLETWLSFAPRGFSAFRRSMPAWFGERLFQKDLLRRALGRDLGGRLLFAEHHQSHAASAFYPSPFEEAAVLTLDGAGEWATTTLSLGRGNRLDMLRELVFPHSLGLLYSAFTGHLGFAVNSGEYKVMGLAALGEPRHAQAILDHLVDVKPDGSFRLDLSYFDYCTGLTMTSPRFAERFGPPRAQAEPLTSHHADLAASVQAVTEDILLRLTRAIAEDTGARHLCLSGGVALNCVANAKILGDGRFDGIWIQPAAGDAGGASGAALAAYYGLTDAPRIVDGRSDGMGGALLGPSFPQAEVEAQLTALGARYEVLADRPLLETTAAALAAGRVVGWVQGRMEFGPRALGNRSILADARSPRMRDWLNGKIKQREAFRPFAPAVLAEDAAEWFTPAVDSPYMLLVGHVAAQHRHAVPPDISRFDRQRLVLSDVPAITHADYSARLQTVDAATNPRFHALLTAFKAATGCPMLVNTSLNGAEEPIVRSPSDAYTCFVDHDLDVLVVGNCLVSRG